MRDWTKREWLLAVGSVAAGFVLARLFPAFWDYVVRPLAIVAFIVMMVRYRRREDGREREEEAKRARERFRGWEEPGPGPAGPNGGLN